MSATIYNDGDVRVLYKETGIVGEPYGISLVEPDGNRVSLTKSQAIAIASEIMLTYFKKPREYWLIAGRYFESEHDAKMWTKNEVRSGLHSYIDACTIHVREVLAE